MEATAADTGGPYASVPPVPICWKRLRPTAQRSLGLDIADFLLMEDTPQMILREMIERNPVLQTFIDTFGLELVDVERTE